MNDCPCGSGKTYAECCESIMKGERPAETPEQVMRARYSSYATAETEYLLTSLHPDKKDDHDPESTKKWADSSNWHSLEILNTEGGGSEDTEGDVEFRATYTYAGEKQTHHELAHFEKVEDIWYYSDGEPVKPETFKRENPKVGRNEPCPCGSGKKYKKCCGP